MSSYSASAATRRGSIVPPLGDIEAPTERVPSECDVLVCGTGLVESIISAALAWQGSNVIHIDPNDYYGGSNACLNIDELIKWVSRVNSNQGIGSLSGLGVPGVHPAAAGAGAHPSDHSERVFANAKLYMPRPLDSRKYLIDLSPHVLFAKSDMLELLIKARIFRYLEFKALGNFHTFENDSFDKVPASKEDIFTDQSLSLVTKRGLMRFMKFVLSWEAQSDVWGSFKNGSIGDFLSNQFKLEPQQITEIVLTIGLCDSLDTKVPQALAQIKRYLVSLDIYGNFPLLYSMYGSGGELAQGFSRSAAVAGAVYKLGVKVQAIREPAATFGGPGAADKKKVACVARLSDGSNVSISEALIMSADWEDDINGGANAAGSASEHVITRMVAIVAKDCKEWFAENEQAAIVIFPPGVLASDNRRPVQVVVMGSGSGQCPEGQAVWYLKTSESDLGRANYDLEEAYKKLQDSILRESTEDFEFQGVTPNDVSYRPDGLPVLSSVKLGQSLQNFVPREKLQNVLKLSYTQRVSTRDVKPERIGRGVVRVPAQIDDLSYDGMISRVKEIYAMIVGSDDDFFDVDFEDEDEQANVGATGLSQQPSSTAEDEASKMDMDEFGHDMEL